MTASDAVIIFARLPVPGKVKTRLAVGVGADRACLFYAACAEHIFRQAIGISDAVPYVYNARAEDDAAVKRWLQSLDLDVVVEAQVADADLGERMRAALQTALDTGHRKVILVGTDIPGLSTDVMIAALAALDDSQLVLGPAMDGGFYLIGATVVPQTLMSGMTWSTSTVRAEVRERAMRLGLRMAPEAALPELQDIDTLQDLQDWVRHPDSGSSRLYAALAEVVAASSTVSVQPEAT